MLICLLCWGDGICSTCPDEVEDALRLGVRVFNLTIETMVWYVYILSLNNGKYYIWSTRNIDERITRHKRWWVKSTSPYLPCELLVYKKYDLYSDAYNIEQKLNKSKSRKITEQYIRDNI